MTDDLSPAAQIDALRDLTQSQGWKLYRAMVMDDIAGKFEDDITKALDVPDAAIAIDRMRQVAAVRKAGYRWLTLPEERLRSLTEQVTQRDEVTHMHAVRRPRGL